MFLKVAEQRSGGVNQQVIHPLSERCLTFGPGNVGVFNGVEGAGDACKRWTTTILGASAAAADGLGTCWVASPTSFTKTFNAPTCTRGL